jgi:hypothetical protein
VKIKTKKQLNLPQLIEWAWENGVRNVRFRGLDKKGYVVSISINDKGEFTSDWRISKNDTFTVETEDEITEDTVIPKLMTTFKKTCLEGGIGYQRVRIDENYPVKLMLNKAEAHREPVETLHIVNDDGTHTLIWRDGKLVE